MEYVNIGICIASFILALVSVITVVITIRQNNRMIENATRPYISIYGQSVITPDRNSEFYLVIRNFGTSVAIMKEFKIEPDSQDCYVNSKARNFLSDMSHAVIAPGQSRICALEYSKLPDELTFTIVYSTNTELSKGFFASIYSKIFKKSNDYHESFNENIKAGAAMLERRFGNSNTKSEISLQGISYSLQEMLHKQL